MHVVIMAGGAGTRFWPLSRRHRPKQLLTLFSDRPMVAETVARFEATVPAERTWIVTSESLGEAVHEAVPSLPAGNVLREPQARNTAPCIALALAAIEESGAAPDAVVAVFPADHYIRDTERLLQTVSQGVRAARDGAIVTLGIEPTRPETGYGYMKRGALGSDGVADVERFVEKPDRETALRYLADGEYLWNAGIFLFRIDTMKAEFARQMPRVWGVYEAMRAALRQGDSAALAEVYNRLPNVSFDYGIMEGATRVRVVPATFGWSDVGAWDALPEVADTDAHGNVCMGDVVAIDCTNSVLVGHDRRVLAAVGLRDLVVVDSEDALLVAPRARVQEVRAIVDALRLREGGLT
jgi:mannose-1-phosphate guanylyltransferase